MLGVSPQHWQPSDVIRWSHILSYTLTNNHVKELTRYSLLQRNFTVERINQIMAAYPATAPTIVSEEDFTLNITNAMNDADVQPPLNAAEIVQIQDVYNSVSVARDRIKRFLPNYDNRGASNSWVVSSAMTETGMPFLANDPHLALNAPNVWWFVHLQSPSFEVIGTCAVGFPSTT